jgi:hypothetical protein
MGFTFEGFDDSGAPIFKYTPNGDQKEATPLKITDAPATNLPKKFEPVPPVSSPPPPPPAPAPSIKPMADTPCTVSCLIFAICVLGAVIITYWSMKD